MAPRPSLLCILLLSAATAVLCTGEKSFENNLGKKELISAQAVRSISRKVLQDYGLTPAAAPALAPAPAPAPAPVAAGAGGNSTSVNGTSGNVTAPGFVYSPGIEYPFFPALFVFGDSLVDTGNSVYLGNPRAATPPYGVTPGGRLNVSGRFSNGPIISDYLATYLGLPLPNPILLPNGTFYSGANFASAGSGALNTTGTLGTVLPLYNQTQLFTNFVQASIAYWSNASAATTVSPVYPKPTSFQSSLYMIVTGGNDLRGFTGNASAFPAFGAAVLASLRSTIQTLYFAGARNFVVANIPQVGCAPGIRNFTVNGVCEPTANAASQQLSLGFETLTQGLQTALPNATFVLFDAFNATAATVAYPAAFGFTNSEDACCGAGGFSNSVTICGDPGATVCANPNEYAFWDQLHPTTAYAQLLAKEIFGGSTFVHPKNVLESFGLPKLQAK